MEPSQHQGKLVNQFLAAEGVGESVTEKLKIPCIENKFLITGRVDSLRPNAVRLPLVGDPKTATRTELAKALTQTINYRPDKVMGISWEAGSVNANVTVAEKGSANLQGTEESLEQIFEMVLKSRANMSSFNWEFDKPYIEVTYQSNQFR